MLRHRLFVCVAAAGCFASNLTAAEQTYPAPAQPVQSSSGYYGFGGFSSTLQEGVQHGFADVARAEGEQAYNLSLAAGHFEDARQKATENHKREVQSYFDLRLLNKRYCRALKAKPAPSPNQPKTDAPDNRPAESAPVGMNGAIYWPVALQGDATRADRKSVEDVFRHRANGYDVKVGSAEYRLASDAIDKISAALQGSIHSVPAVEYIAAKKLLAGLKRELGRPAESRVVSTK